MFKVTITNAEEVVFYGDAVSLTVPASEGEMTILKNHVPIITSIKNGTIRLNGELLKEISVNGGVLEFKDNSAMILLS